MQLPASRFVVIISGLLTLLVLGGGTLAVGFHNGWLRTASDTPSRESASASAQPRHAGRDVPVTQAAPAVPTQGGTKDEAAARGDDDRFTEHDGDDNLRERRSARRESHDE